MQKYSFIYIIQLFFEKVYYFCRRFKIRKIEMQVNIVQRDKAKNKNAFNCLSR
jgi:hypothetical protein